MWIAKGILLGTLAFVVGSIIYVVAMIGMGTASATGTTALQSWTRGAHAIRREAREGS
jgi:hypothetical protein